MVPMDPRHERLLKLVSDARDALGLDRQADLIRASGLSRSTVRRFERGEPIDETSLRRLSRAIGWTPDSAQDVLAGGEPTLAAAVPTDAEARYEFEYDPDAPEGVGMIVRNTVIEVIGVLAPGTPLSEVQEIEARALAAVLRRGGQPRQRHPQAYQGAKADDFDSQ